MLLGGESRQRKAVPTKENADPTNCFPGQAGCFDDQRLVLRRFPVKLRHDLPGGGLKDQRAVSFGPRRPNKTLPGFDHLPGSDQHRPAGEVGRENGSRCSCSDAMERPCCDIGHGLGCGGFYRKPPVLKLRLAQENSPLWRRAYSPAWSFSSVTKLPGNKPFSQSTTAARACCPAVRPLPSTAQTAP